MIGRVHRIGQTRQTYVHRLCVDGSFERSLASERQARSVSAHQLEQGGEAVYGTGSLD
jgi:SNF2 family DNA or RNA helicase